MNSIEICRFALEIIRFQKTKFRHIGQTILMPKLSSKTPISVGIRFF